ncbi:MAG: phage recombination protein Bet [Ruminococcus sp.]|nr:phage recombination protein Bet [Ruminococcus sp.]
MAVKNTLIKTQEAKPSGTTFTAGGNQITLNKGIVKQFLVNGDAQNVTDQEVVMFIKLCQYQGLNPFLKEAYLIKYGSQPATIVTGKTALEKRAARCEKYRGFEAGVVVVTAEGELDYRTGTLVLPGEQLVGGWADVYVEGFGKPVKSVASLEEYIGRKKDGSVNAQWSAKPATMIRKVAKMQALREAFPEDFQGMYSAEEMNVQEELSEVPIEQPAPDEIIVEPAPPEEDFASLMEG